MDFVSDFFPNPIALVLFKVILAIGVVSLTKYTERWVLRIPCFAGCLFFMISAYFSLHAAIEM